MNKEYIKVDYPIFKKCLTDIVEVIKSKGIDYVKKHTREVSVDVFVKYNLESSNIITAKSVREAMRMALDFFKQSDSDAQKAPLTFSLDMIRAFAFKDAYRLFESEGQIVDKEAFVNTTLVKYNLPNSIEVRNAIETGFNWAKSEYTHQ